MCRDDRTIYNDQAMEMINTRMVKQTEMKRVVELKVLYNQLCANLNPSFMELLS
jgi:hypothetical protein